MVCSVNKPLCAELLLGFSQESLLLWFKRETCPPYAHVSKHLFPVAGAVCEGYGTFRRRWSLSRGSRAGGGL